MKPRGKKQSLKAALFAISYPYQVVNKFGQNIGYFGTKKQAEKFAGESGDYTVKETV